MRKLQLLKEAAVASLLFMLLTFLLGFLPFKFEFTKGIRQGLFGFDIYDLHFSNKHRANYNLDNRIVLVEIGASRAEIARQLEVLAQYNPRVIGLDAFFEERDTTDEFNDLRLEAVITRNPNIVLADRNIRHGDSIYHYPNVFHHPVTHLAGYADLTAYNEYVVIRSFYPFLTRSEKTHESFTSAILHKYDPQLYKDFREREKEDEIINYTRGLKDYLNMTVNDLAEFDSTGQLPLILKDKVVLVGYFDKNNQVLSDLYFTPLNARVVGKSYPDLYGVVIHANILSMLLDSNYATMLPELMSYVIAYLIVFLMLLFILSQYKKKVHPNHGWLLLIQLLTILVMLYLFLLLFDLTLIKADLVPMVVGLVLSLEALGLYKMLALWLHNNKRLRYQTIFSKKEHV